MVSISILVTKKYTILVNAGGLRLIGFISGGQGVVGSKIALAEGNQIST